MICPPRRSGQKGSIAIVTPHLRGRPVPLTHPFFLELIGEAARARDCDFVVSHISPASYDDLVHAMTTSRARGVIFLGAVAAVATGRRPRLVASPVSPDVKLSMEGEHILEGAILGGTKHDLRAFLGNVGGPAVPSLF